MIAKCARYTVRSFTGPLYPAAGAGAGMSLWLEPGHLLKRDTALLGHSFMATIVSRRVSRGVRACVCAIEGTSRQHLYELFESFDFQVSGDHVVFDVSPGPRNHTEHYVLLALETLTLQFRAKGILSRCSVGAIDLACYVGCRSIEQPSRYTAFADLPHPFSCGCRFPVTAGDQEELSVGTPISSSTVTAVSGSDGEVIGRRSVWPSGPEKLNDGELRRYVRSWIFHTLVLKGAAQSPTHTRARAVIAQAPAGGGGLRRKLVFNEGGGREAQLMLDTQPTAGGRTLVDADRIKAARIGDPRWRRSDRARLPTADQAIHASDGSSQGSTCQRAVSFNLFFSL
ncbi:hypothetical protein EVAR_75256_1 [Eumeta japonica]|uniref:Uncharacterized protein n=1 Tax=Eumeta variegata TaxID=151549 RepID=A0A4C1V898_EUMVA|nr:hypothetical protein EVAR_75256_1 [Eumeta japonica]